ncbi:MAG: hypothetical protein ACREQ5_04295 [Candidatus Dormibacteria bacterium]
MADYGQIAETAADYAAGAVYSALMIYIQDNFVDLADSYHTLYDTQRQFYYNNFQINGEAVLNTDVFGTAVGQHGSFYVPNYDGSLPTSSLSQFYPQFFAVSNNISKDIFYKSRMYETNVIQVPFSSYQFYTNFNIEQSEIQDDWYSYFFRYEEHKRDIYNERRWVEQIDSLSYGVKEAAQVERGLAVAFTLFDDANAGIVSALNTTANGYFGYLATSKQMKELMETPKADHIFSSSFGG